MKKFTTLFMSMMILVGSAFAQKVKYKNGEIEVDGKVIATVNKIKDKENLGLTSTFELFSMSGEKLIIGTWSGEFEEDKDNTMDQYYRLSFLTVDMTGIFTIAKLGAEKSFANLIGKAEIIVDDKLDPKLVKEFIAKKGRTPKIAVDYSLVNRNKSWPLRLMEDKTIEQDSKTIGTFKDVSPNGQAFDRYEFALPTGIVIAEVTFTGGNNAQNCEMQTKKDSRSRTVSIPTDETITFSASSIDRNQWVLKRIVQWLVSNEYL